MSPANLQFDINDGLLSPTGCFSHSHFPSLSLTLVPLSVPQCATDLFPRPKIDLISRSRSASSKPRMLEAASSLQPSTSFEGKEESEDRTRTWNRLSSSLSLSLFHSMFQSAVSLSLSLSLLALGFRFDRASFLCEAVRRGSDPSLRVDTSLERRSLSSLYRGMSESERED